MTTHYHWSIYAMDGTPLASFELRGGRTQAQRIRRAQMRNEFKDYALHAACGKGDVPNGAILGKLFAGKLY